MKTSHSLLLAATLCTPMLAIAAALYLLGGNRPFDAYLNQLQAIW